ncbi:MAG: MBL fold metallo-hydrolase [Bacteroidales bacterium]|nr:MBL fold metallo-hydrolase [Bacteroidales bacterium]MBN2755546.1 MBL fold metallo-hydrolase [Bacteroidales bacterium]
MKVTFLGTGTSQGVPVIACECDVCKSKDSKDKRLRSSIMIEINDKTIVIDTGPDFRQQMLRENVKKLDAILFTHEHKDHIAGLDDIRAFNYIHKKPMDIYAEQRVHEALKREYAYVFAEFKYPGIPEMEMHVIDNKTIKICGIDVTPIRVMHYKLPIFGFRIKDFSYITDTNSISDVEKNKIIGSKIIVINALRKKKHISHFNLQEALNFIDEIKPEMAYLTHISHLMGLQADVELELPENVKFAYDGLKIEIE